MSPAIMMMGIGLMLGQTASSPHPRVAFASYLGGGEEDTGYGIAVDAAGYIYVAGLTASTDFPVVQAAQPTLGGGQSDAFVVKLTPDGASIVYATYLGGDGDDVAYALTVDGSGNAYVAGSTGSSNFPTVAALQPASGGGEEGFVTKLDPNGAIVFSTYLGGQYNERIQTIAVDSTGNVFVAGQTGSPDFPLKDALQATAGGGNTDAFVSSLSADGSELRYSTLLGGNGIESGNAIAVDPSGNAFVAGYTSSSDFPLQGPLQAVYAGGGADAFVLMLDPQGSALVYSTYLGGQDVDSAYALFVDASGSAYVTGTSASSDFPLKDALQSALSGATDAFLAKLDPSGNALSYSTYLGGKGDEAGLGIAVDSVGQAWVTGETTSLDFPLTNAVQGAYGGGAQDVFVAQMSATGALGSSTYLGGRGLEGGQALAVSAEGDVLIGGYTFSTDFPTVTPFQKTLAGSGDALVVRFTFESDVGVQTLPTPKNQVSGCACGSAGVELPAVWAAFLWALVSVRRSPPR